jgi:hypothetical protein
MIWIEIGPEKELGNHLFPLVEFPVLGLVLCLNLLFRYMLRPLFVLSVVYCPWCGSSWQSYIVLVLTCGLKLAGILHLPAKILGVLFFSFCFWDLHFHWWSARVCRRKEETKAA